MPSGEREEFSEAIEDLASDIDLNASPKALEGLLREKQSKIERKVQGASVVNARRRNSDNPELLCEAVLRETSRCGRLQGGRSKVGCSPANCRLEN
jgi:hypothetical protein